MSDAILVATGEREKPENYIRVLELLGVPAERIRLLKPSPEINRDARRLAARAAGLVLCGGPDIDPKYFGEEVIPGARVSIEADRDDMELELLAGAREAATPVWGICRGLQVINVFLGGTLWQDIPRQLAGSLLHHLMNPPDALIHPVAVTDRGTPLGEVLAREPALVNSRHHQGIKQLAPGLIEVGRAPDGVVEAASLADGEWWLHAVQWHPENLIALPQQRALWERFLEAVERRRQERGEPAVAAGTR